MTQSLLRKEMLGFNSRKYPPQIDEMKPFEDNQLTIIENIQFKKSDGNFQQTLKVDIKKFKIRKKWLFLLTKQETCMR